MVYEETQETEVEECSTVGRSMFAPWRVLRRTVRTSRDWWHDGERRERGETGVVC